MDKYYVARITRNWNYTFFLPYRDLVVSARENHRLSPSHWQLSHFPVSGETQQAISSKGLRLPGYRADLSIEDFGFGNFS